MTMAFWDTQCMKRRTAAIGGSDAHGARFKWGPLHFKPLSYDYLFKTINIHILLTTRMSKNFETAKISVYEALREGRLYIAHDKIHPAKGFRFNYIADDGSNLFMGEEGKFASGNLVVELQEEGEIRLFRNGKLMRKQKGTEAVYRVEAGGVYRIEVYRNVFLFGMRPWIFSNPIYLR